MAPPSVRGLNMMSSSPPSSDVATYNGTPSTRATPFSNDRNNCNTNGNPALTLPTPSRMSAHNNFNSLNDALLHLPINYASELSPHATEFTPQPEDGNAATPRANYSQPIGVRGNASTSTHKNISASIPIRTVESSQALTVTAPPTESGRSHGARSSQLPGYNFHPNVTAPPMHRNQANGPSAPLVVPAGLPFNVAFSTDEGLSRSICIDKMKSFRDVEIVAHILDHPSYKTVLEVDTSKFGLDHAMLITFGDVVEAKRAYALIVSMNYNWRLSFITATQAASHIGRDIRRVSDYPGQIIASVSREEPGSHLSKAELLSYLAHSLRRHGELKAIEELPSRLPEVFEFRVEYQDARDANVALNHGDDRYAPVVVKYEPFTPDLSQTSAVRDSNAVWWYQQSNFVLDSKKPSATGRSTVPTGDPAYDYLIRELHQEPPRKTRDGHRTDRNGQYIDIHRIRAGIDVRTTVMLRNIPNRMDLEELKDFIDQYSFGHYDFLYLRIDFANNCNVGYAFINFVDPAAIIEFACAIQGLRWNYCNSDKVAEISYATVQGRENLIQKFRNSAIMLECPAYRPKLYFAIGHPLCGQEEMFPAPDNLQKMRRSMENAETVGLYKPTQIDYIPQSPPATIAASSTGNMVRAHARNDASALPGVLAPSPPLTHSTTRSYPTPLTPGHDFPQSSLFAPRQGQVYREQQRRRQSQFDRGTPGAEAELSAAMGGLRISPTDRAPPGFYRYSNN